MENGAREGQRAARPGVFRVVAVPEGDARDPRAGRNCFLRERFAGDGMQAALMP